MSALVVGPDDGDRSLLVEALRGLGLLVLVADGFTGARELLATARPDVLITELRLGAYNGLHLVLRCKTVRPGMKAIVLTGTPDPVLQQEAAQLDAELLVRDAQGNWTERVVAAAGPLAGTGRVLAFKPAGS